MANCYHHSLSSVKKYKGTIEDYIKIHMWFDESKSHYANVRHRAHRHHSFGIWQCEQEFGTAIKNSIGIMVPVRFIGEQHVMEDLGFIPSLQDWLSLVEMQPWMMRAGPLSHEMKLEEQKNANKES